MSEYEYDLFVIGAGSGGVRAARLVSAMGKRVGIAEESRIGGTCVIRGCVPKKLLVYASQLGKAIEDASGFGWQVEGRRFDWPTLIANKDREIDRLNAVYTRNLEASGAEVFMSRARLLDAHTIQLEADGRKLMAQTILIATGGRPFLPNVPGVEHAITSNEAFYLSALPGHIVIAGGGYIGVEFAGIFAGLGAKVTLLHRGEQILRGFDQDMRDALSAAMTKSGVDLHMATEVSAITREGNGLSVTCTGGQTFRADQMMFATGRIPNTSGIGLEDAGIELGWNGHVVVNEFSRTSAANIFAIGDVTDRVQLTPVAIDEAVRFVETAFRNNPTAVDHTYIPTAVFSQPEIGTVGLPEHEAREKYPDIDIYLSRFRPMKATLSGRDETMIMKLIVDAESNIVIGAHIIGPDAAEMAQLLAIPMRLNATKADFDATMALHPSAAEELVTMREKLAPPSARAAE